MMYISFIGSTACTFFLSYPATDYIVHGIEWPVRFTLAMPWWLFAPLTMLLGLFMALGNAAVYKHIPVYYPGHVGVVAGLVGMIGGLGGFFLPISFGIMNDLIGVWTSCFMLMFTLVAIALTWMHFAIRRMEQAALAEELKKLPALPEMAEIHTEEHAQAMAKYFKRRFAMSRLLDRFNFFVKAKTSQFGSFAHGHGVTTDESRAWEEGYRSRWAYWLVLVKDLCQGRYHHLGDPTDRLS